MIDAAPSCARLSGPLPGLPQDGAALAQPDSGLSDAERIALARLAWLFLGSVSTGHMALWGLRELGPVGAAAGALVAILLTVMALLPR